MNKVLFCGLALLAACGGPAGRNGHQRPQSPTLPAADPEALREFDAALRALRLGGPKANQKAQERLRRAVELDEKLWEAWHNLGVVLLQDGAMADASEAFGRALHVNPVHGPALAGRAEAYRSLGQSGKARKDYRRLLEMAPEQVRTYARLASLLRHSGRFDDGLDVLREGLRIVGATPAIYVELSLIYLEQGRDELAELVLNKAHALDPKNPSLYNARALLALSRENDQLAFQHFDRAAALDPSYVDTRFNKASVLIDAGDYQSAARELKVILEQAPEDLDALVALGIAHRGLGSFEKARTLWEKVVETAPRRGRARGDALFNLAVLEMDFIMDDKKAVAALDRYLQNSSTRHPKRKAAKERREELGL